MKQRALKELAIPKPERPAAPARPVKEQHSAVFGRMEGTIETVGDIVASTGERWHADE
jgi:hypothetical protein